MHNLRTIEVPGWSIAGLFLMAVLGLAGCESPTPSPIDREAVVQRHHPQLQAVDTLGSFSLGNGRFAMTMDVTGLQTFPATYAAGIPLGTQAEWGWHRFPAARDFAISETLAPIQSHGREVPYARQWPSDTPQGEAANYIRQNPHRIHLAQVGWEIVKKDGSIASVSDISEISQELDLWRGALVSRFMVDGEAVEVTSLVEQDNDRLQVQVKSELIEHGRLRLKLSFPYPTGQWLDVANQYDEAEQERLTISSGSERQFAIRRTLDSTTYHTQVSSSLALASRPHAYGYLFEPAEKGNLWQFSVGWSEQASREPRAFEEARQITRDHYQAFWNSGGMIDFGAVEDPRAHELERRMILSLYLTHVNCRGTSPPQETGLTYNSWYGKPHLEMAWWHGVHFALWGRPEVLEGHMDWYLRNGGPALEIASRQGFDGLRWQKMTDNQGGETVSSVGSYLIWQQPHPIYFAELIYRARPSMEVVERYADVIEQTANFMADFAWYRDTLDRFILGPGVIPAQERFDPQATFNPTYELAYWRWGLEVAQQWRQRMGQPRKETWDRVLKGLSPLPVGEGVYLATESAADSYTNPRFMTDHPSVLGTYGMLPATKGLDIAIMRRTFDKIWEQWHWEETWGWDFPMTAMTATRLGDPARAVESLLMDVPKNNYLVNGHNYQRPNLRLYLPGNGGLLAALALMAAGSDGTPSDAGFPADWIVRHEGLVKMP